MQEGDIAGSKLVKFYRHLKNEINKFYTVSSDGFDYGGKKEAQFFFVAKSRGKIISRGPDANDKRNAALFKKKHRNTFIKGGKIYTEEKIEKDIEKFIKEWMNSNYEKMNDMHINELSIES